MKNNNPKWNVEEMELFFSKTTPTEEMIAIPGGERVMFGKQFITGHIQCCKTYNGNKTFLPYWERLVLLREVVERRMG